MYLLGEQPAYADQLINRLQSIPTQLLEGLEPVGAAVTFERVDDLAPLLPGMEAPAWTWLTAPLNPRSSTAIRAARDAAAHL